jgi:hypothetical protein
MASGAQTFHMLFPSEPTSSIDTTSIPLPIFDTLPTILHVVLILSLLPPLYLLLADYKAYLSLGPGGTPSTPMGYLRIKLLSLFVLKDPYRPDSVHPHFTPGALQPASFPARAGPRPTVAGIAPHRQTTQRAPAQLFAQLSAALHELAARHCTRLGEGTSCFEKHGTGLFARHPVVRTCRGEICHVHPSDGSLHLSLHPADAKLVLERGWGERHPLARGGWFRRFVPREFVMVYAPRDEKEVGVVVTIVCAAAWWVGGRKLGLEEAERDAEGGEKAQEEVDTVATETMTSVRRECGESAAVPKILKTS